MKPLQEQFSKTFVPEKSEEEKIKAIDSSIKCCLAIIVQDLDKRKDILPETTKTVQDATWDIIDFTVKFQGFKNNTTYDDSH